MAEPKVSIENLSFEKALEELQVIVKSLESGQTPLEESISAYERGVALKTHCEKKLSEARSKIEKINISSDGTVSTAPFGSQE